MKRQLDLETLVLDSGGHEFDEDDLNHAMCVMEAVAYVAGEDWSDHPVCASPVIAAFCRAWNDSPEPYGAVIRERLKHYIPRLVGSRASREIEDQRGWLALDWLIRVQLVAWLRLAHLDAQANALAALPAQISGDALRSSAAARDAARDAARAAARAAAWAAARDARDASDAALDAARAAAWAAAWDAARAAAWDAARAAARAAASDASDAALDAARAAARDASDAALDAALDATVEELQASAWELLERMLAVTESEA